MRIAIGVSGEPLARRHHHGRWSRRLDAPKQMVFRRPGPLTFPAASTR
jgi:Txe/YoeB family toxin of Txe-Axe toxin-antitoxin module